MEEELPASQGLSDEFNFDDAVGAAQDGAADMDSIANALLSQLTLAERLSLLDGDDTYWSGLYSMLMDGYNRVPIIHGEVERLGIPGVRFADGPRGCVLGESTAFPVPMARGASWDISLEERIGTAIGRECRAQGANFFGGVCVNLPRHPAWGRIQETYGEDPILLGKLGAALARGVQKNVMACVKHYALNSMENARFQVNVNIDEATLHEVYLAHFRYIVEQGVASVMSSYNSVRGEWAGQNKELLLDILRGEWGFKGFVISDFLFGLRDAVLSLKNGLDIEAPFRNQRALRLGSAFESGKLGNTELDRSCIAILRRQVEDATWRDATFPSNDVVFCEEHRDLAKEAAVKSMVLLKNEVIDGQPTLPLNAATISRLAVVGRLANSSNTGDRGSSAVRCPRVVSAYQGLKAALPQSEVLLEDSEDIQRVGKAAAAADVAIVVVGYDYKDEGEFTVPPFKTNPDLKKILPPGDGSSREKFITSLLFNEKSSGEVATEDNNYGFGAGGDRTNLRLRSQDVELIKATVEANPRTIVSIVAAGAVIMEEWKQLPPAIVFSWYSGCEGGHALADLLLGQANFSGRLPFSIPTSEDHLPYFDKDALQINYDRWFGQHLLDRLQVEAAYPLGFGLSYTTFKVSSFDVEPSEGDNITLQVRVANMGQCKGRFIAQVYGTVDVPDWPSKSLLGFAVAELDKAEEKTIQVAASTRPLQRWDRGSWTPVSNIVGIEVGSYAGDKESVRACFNM